ncbi:MAG: hypothetical protein KatS3mg057_2961 [Herpetosiphonaceae bacterium]|nr:MAG: hypothetical protein KatS3mg057_2961 [Herpetosiphonaceae bacterium]
MVRNPSILVILAILGLTCLALATEQGTASWSAPLDERIRPDMLRGFHQPERLDGAVYRWTTEQASLALPLPGTHSLAVLRLRAPEATPVILATDLHRLAAVAGPIDRQYRMIVPQSADQLVIESPTFHAPGDGRPLGVVVSHVMVGGSWQPRALLELPGLALLMIPALSTLAAWGHVARMAVIGAFTLAIIVMLVRIALAWLLLGGALVLLMLVVGLTAATLVRPRTWRLRLGMAGATLLASLLAGAGLLPATAAWGIQPVLALSPALSGLALIAALLLAPLVAGRLPDDGIPIPGAPRWLWAGIAGSLFALMGLLLRVRTSEGDAQVIQGYIESGMFVHWKQPLDFWLHAMLYRMAHARWGWLSATTYHALSLVAGIIYAVVAACCAFDWGDTWWRRLGVFLALCGSGTLIFFAGYIESYALVTAALLGYVWAGWRALERGTSPLVAGLILGIAIVLHPLALWGLPALGLLIWLLRHRGGWRAGLGVLIPILLVVGGFSLAGHGPWTAGQHKDAIGGYDGGLFVPLRAANGTTEHYTLFAREHLIAWLNVLFLAAPAALACIWLGWARRERANVFFVALIAGALLWSFLWNPDLGPQQDWDLLAVGGLPLVAGAAWRYAQLPRPEARALFLPLVVPALLVVLGWFAMHR